MAKIKPHKEPRFIQEQHDMLMRCSSAKDMSEWNDWRKMNRSQKVLLEGAQFKNAYLKDANFRNVQMKKASFSNSNLENARFLLAKLEFAGVMVKSCVWKS